MRFGILRRMWRRVRNLVSRRAPSPLAISISSSYFMAHNPRLFPCETPFNSYDSQADISTIAPEYFQLHRNPSLSEIATVLRTLTETTEVHADFPIAFYDPELLEIIDQSSYSDPEPLPGMRELILGMNHQEAQVQRSQK